MSRLIVKNLPKNITEDKIRELFGQKGTVTDVQLKYTPDGKFRQFAFVGYQLENEAEEAKKYFDNMFIKTNKIQVETCALLGDSKKPKAWSKYASDSTSYKQTHPEVVEEENTTKQKEKKKKKKTVDEATELLKKYKDDPLFEEFLKIRAPEQTKKLQVVSNISSKSEASSDESDKEQNDDKDDEDEEPQQKLANAEISDMDYMKQLKKRGSEQKKKEPRQINLFTLKLRDIPYNCKKKDIKHFFKPLVPFTIRKPVKIPGIAYVGFKTEKELKSALLKNKSFIAGKQIYVARCSANNEKNELNDQTGNLKKEKWKSQEESLRNEEDIGESGKIFVRNLAYTTTEDDVEKLFSKYGPLAEVNLPIDFVTKKIKGFGIVTFVMPEHAVKAYEDLDGSVLHGRMLHLLPGKSKDSENLQESLEESTNYKKKKALKQKAQAGSSHNWNSLFLGHNAVVEGIAEKYDKTKEDVLDPHGNSNVAVRLALGETQFVAQIRQYLEKEGVVLDAFNNVGSKRSKTLILVKNLPNRTETKEIRELFEKHGTLGRVILPPSGITALVEFAEPSEARKAFTSLAYKKFKNVPLYLEWAPENSLSDKKITVSANLSDCADETTNNQEPNEKIEDVVEEEPELDTTLFVKNLNFRTTDEDLRKHFESCGKVFYATVAKKKDTANPEKKLSMGYGFVRFFYKEDANKALINLQQKSLDGKSLELKRSERTLNEEVKTAKKTSKLIKQTGTKILVRNVPFQANRKELWELFSTFGEIKALRLPKKMALDSSSHRGFAFVDFTTTAGAKSAFEALAQSTHLYGRRLVLEWATTEEGVDEIRKRTAEHFRESEVVKSKKSVLNIE